MEPLFEVRMVYDYETTFKKGVRAHYKYIQGNSRTFVLVLAIFWTALAFLGFMFAIDVVWSVICAMLAIVMFFMFFMGETLALKAAYKNTTTLNPTGDFTLHFFDDRLIAYTPLSQNTIFYSQVTKAVETNDLYLLAFLKMQFLFAEKDKFTKGNPNELGRFLQARIKNYKIKY